jgi:hypothetical protein
MHRFNGCNEVSCAIDGMGELRAVLDQQLNGTRLDALDETLHTRGLHASWRPGLDRRSGGHIRCRRCRMGKQARRCDEADEAAKQRGVQISTHLPPCTVIDLLPSS